MKKLLSIFILLSVALVLFAPVLTHADEKPCVQNKSKGVYCCGGTQTSIDFNCAASDKPGSNTLTSLALTAVNFLAAGVGIAVVGGIVFGGIRYATANGNASQAQQGVTYIVNSVIGLLLFVFMYAIINFLVPGGLFT